MSLEDMPLRHAMELGRAPKTSGRKRRHDKRARMVRRAACGSLLSESERPMRTHVALFVMQFVSIFSKSKRGARGRRVEDERERDASCDVMLRAPDIS